MPAERLTLADDEREIATPRRHPAAFLVEAVAPLLLLLASVALTLAGLALPADGGIVGIIDAIVGIAALAAAISGVAILVGVAIPWRSVRVILTDRRVVRREGLGARVTADLPLDRITDIVRRDGPLGSRLGYGDLLLMAETGPAVELQDLRDPAAFRDRLVAARDALTAARAAVREADARAAAGLPAALPPVIEAIAGTAEALPAVEPEPDPEPEPEAASDAGSQETPGAAAATTDPRADAATILAALDELARMRDAGTIDAEDYAAKKAELLARL